MDGIHRPHTKLFADIGGRFAYDLIHAYERKLIQISLDSPTQVRKIRGLDQARKISTNLNERDPRRHQNGVGGK